MANEYFSWWSRKVTICDACQRREHLNGAGFSLSMTVQNRLGILNGRWAKTVKNRQTTMPPQYDHSNAKENAWIITEQRMKGQTINPRSSSVPSIALMEVRLHKREEKDTRILSEYQCRLSVTQNAITSNKAQECPSLGHVYRTYD